ncbi:HAD family hydrolase [Candidatus Nitrosotenuis aquarius]|uniref:HAD family hydrolase n=1 Tax=Candidatus Nitrosotenuis aquarius TaxID=1846278 RepID=UPI000C1E8076|nr:HAD family hydrolase [Candidatus Nitrosotenuis aquarius]
MKYYKKSGILIKKDSLKNLIQVDTIIFDCDGVLVDVSKSYDLAIKQTTAFVLDKFAGIKSIPISSEIISGFKASGGFNDEVDVTYALILSLVAAKRLGIDAKKFINKVIDNADSTGIISVEKFLDTVPVDISDIKKKLQYPGPHSTNPLYRIFDQMFYGKDLYKKIFGKKSQFKKGLIENDIVLVTQKLMDSLEPKFAKKIAIVTGRGKESTKYSLNKLFGKFNIDSSFFLEDHPRTLAKPNPKSLIMSINRLKSKHCLYVGDSMEDLIMAKKASKLGKKTIFCGIYGTAQNPNSKKRFFEKNNADIIIQSIDLIPKALNLAH